MAFKIQVLYNAIILGFLAFIMISLAVGSGWLDHIQVVHMSSGPDTHSLLIPLSEVSRKHPK